MIQDIVNNKPLINFNDNNLSSNPQLDINSHYFCNIHTLKQILKTHNNKRSSGIDGIPNIAIKNLPDNILLEYTILFNNMLNNYYFPEKWKTARIKALKKDRDDRLLGSYRPISLLPNISKIFEILLNKALLKYSNDNDVVPDAQFGFRFKHSAIHAVNKFTSDVS